MKILFICKRNELYSFQTYTRRSSGLYNSTRFIVEALQSRGVQAKIIEVVDNNCIDREVTEFKPDVVVIEALWVVPEKFDVFKKLHPKVKWCIHLHSDMPFLALEGIAMEWVAACSARGVTMIANSRESYAALLPICPKLVFLPNVYVSKPRRAKLFESAAINIACFGAIRPMKNHLLQALAGIRFAKEVKRPLMFHINGTRVETGGAPVLKNLQQLFEAHPQVGKLVSHGWYEPEDFLSLLQDQMNLGMQVSLTETFNVVTADYVTAGLPIVVSKEVKWASRFSWAKENSIDDIVRKMHCAWGKRWLVQWNQHLLLKASAQAQDAWFQYFRSIK